MASGILLLKHYQSNCMMSHTTTYKIRIYLYWKILHKEVHTLAVSFPLLAHYLIMEDFREKNF